MTNEVFDAPISAPPPCMTMPTLYVIFGSGILSSTTVNWQVLCVTPSANFPGAVLLTKSVVLVLLII